jgi:hypothetical protein
VGVQSLIAYLEKMMVPLNSSRGRNHAELLAHGDEATMVAGRVGYYVLTLTPVLGILQGPRASQPIDRSEGDRHLGLPKGM